MIYLGVWNNFHLKCLSLYESLDSFKVHPPVGQELLDKDRLFSLKRQIDQVSYKLLVLNILNFSIDLNSFTWIEIQEK